MNRDTGPDSIRAGPAPGAGEPAEGARADWEQRIYRRADSGGSAAGPELPAPARVAADAGAGHVRLTWDLVPGAAGYVIERSGPDGATEILRHGGSDAADLHGDGAGALVQAWASRHADGMVDVLVWNGTINAALVHGDPRLDRHVELTITGLRPRPYQARLARVDERHSNVVAHCPPDVIWPDDALWARLRQRDGLHTERLPDVTPDGGAARFGFDLPMPGIARIRLSAGQAGIGASPATRRETS